MLDFHPESKRTDIGQAIEYLTRVMKRKCTAFVLSDFYVRQDFEQPLRIVNQKHDVVAIQIYDQRAKVLPDVGIIKVKDAETDHEMYLDTSSPKLRQAHTRDWMRRQEKLREVFAKSNVDWTSVATNEDFAKALISLFAQRG